MKSQSSTAIPFQISSHKDIETTSPDSSPIVGLLSHFYLLAFLAFALAARTLAISDEQLIDEPFLLTVLFCGGAVIAATWLLCRRAKAQ